MMQGWIVSLVLEIGALDGNFIMLVISFKRAALPVANTACVISMDCRIVSMGGLEITQESHIVTCFNAANHKRMTMMRAGRIVLFKMKHNRAMKRVSTMAIRPSLASVRKTETCAPLDIQMTDTASCLAAAKNKQMIQVVRSVLAILLEANLL
jgi:hypothetical protein